MATKALKKYRTKVVKVRSRRKAGFTLPLAAIAGFGPLAGQIYFGYKTGRGLEGMIHYGVAALTGYDTDGGPWQPMYAVKNGLGPIILGVMVHKLASKLGVNRTLAGAGVPWIRI